MWPQATALISLNAVVSMIKPLAIMSLNAWVTISGLLSAAGENVVALVQFGDCVPSKADVERLRKRLKLLDELRQLTADPSTTAEELEGFLLGRGSIIKDLDEWQAAYRTLARREMEAKEKSTKGVGAAASPPFDLLKFLAENGLWGAAMGLCSIVAVAIGAGTILLLDSAMEVPTSSWIAECGLTPHTACIFFEPQCLHAQPNATERVEKYMTELTAGTNLNSMIQHFTGALILFAIARFGGIPVPFLTIVGTIFWVVYMCLQFFQYLTVVLSILMDVMTFLALRSMVRVTCAPSSPHRMHGTSIAHPCAAQPPVASTAVERAHLLTYSTPNGRSILASSSYLLTYLLTYERQVYPCLKLLLTYLLTYSERQVYPCLKLTQGGGWLGSPRPAIDLSAAASSLVVPAVISRLLILFIYAYALSSGLKVGLHALEHRQRWHKDKAYAKVVYLAEKAAREANDAAVALAHEAAALEHHAVAAAALADKLTDAKASGSGPSPTDAEVEEAEKAADEAQTAANEALDQADKASRVAKAKEAEAARTIETSGKLDRQQQQQAWGAVGGNKSMKSRMEAMMDKPNKMEMVVDSAVADSLGETVAPMELEKHHFKQKLQNHVQPFKIATAHYFTAYAGLGLTLVGCLLSSSLFAGVAYAPITISLVAVIWATHKFVPWLEDSFPIKRDGQSAIRGVTGWFRDLAREQPRFRDAIRFPLAFASDAPEKSRIIGEFWKVGGGSSDAGFLTLAWGLQTFWTAIALAPILCFGLWLSVPTSALTRASNSRLRPPRTPGSTLAPLGPCVCLGALLELGP